LARADKHVTSARNYSLVVLALSGVLAVLVAREGVRWTNLSSARDLCARWLVHDVVAEDFEEWWLQQQVAGQPVTATYVLSAELNAGKERYYSSFGAALVKGGASEYAVAVGQPSEAPPIPEGLPNVPDLRAPIPDLRSWSRELMPSAALRRALTPLTATEADVLTGTIALNTRFVRDDPRGRRLPQLQEEWVADTRWLALEAEKEAIGTRLRELLAPAGIKADDGDIAPMFYRRLERSLSSTQMRVPILDVELPIPFAMWVCTLLVVLNGWLLMAALRGLVKEMPMQRDEEWLVVDAPRDFLARSWLALMLVCPVAVPVMAFSYFLVGFAAGDGSWSRLLGTGAVLLVLACLAGILSYKTFGYVRAAQVAATLNERESANKALQRTRRKAARR
jgi:hypothetical protein